MDSYNNSNYMASQAAGYSEHYQYDGAGGYATQPGTVYYDDQNANGYVYTEQPLQPVGYGTSAGVGVPSHPTYPAVGGAPRDGVYYSNVLPFLDGTRPLASGPSQILVESNDASFAAAKEKLRLYADAGATEPLRVHADVSKAFVDRFLYTFNDSFATMVELFLVTDNNLTTARVFKALQDVPYLKLVRLVQRTRPSECLDPASVGIDEHDLCLGSFNRLASLRHLATDSARWIIGDNEHVNLSSLQTLILHKQAWGPDAQEDSNTRTPHLQGQEFIHVLASTPNLVNLSIYQWITNWSPEYYQPNSITLPSLRYLRMDRPMDTAPYGSILTCPDFLHLLAPTSSLRVVGFNPGSERLSFNTQSRPDLFPPGYNYRNYYTACKFPSLTCLSLQAGYQTVEAWSQVADLFGDGITHLALTMGPTLSDVEVPNPFIIGTLREDWTSVKNILVLSSPYLHVHVPVWMEDCDSAQEVLMGPSAIKSYLYRVMTGTPGYGLTEDMVKDIATWYPYSWEFPIEAVDYREKLAWGEDGWAIFADDLDFCK